MVAEQLEFCSKFPLGSGISAERLSITLEVWHAISTIINFSDDYNLFQTCSLFCSHYHSNFYVKIMMKFWMIRIFSLWFQMQQYVIYCIYMNDCKIVILGLGEVVLALIWMETEALGKAYWKWLLGKCFNSLFGKARQHKRNTWSSWWAYANFLLINKNDGGTSNHLRQQHDTILKANSEVWTCKMTYFTHLVFWSCMSLFFIEIDG